MGLFKKKPQNIKFFAITDKNNSNIFYTFTNTYAESLEYLAKLFVYKNKMEHFVQWCEFHEKDKSLLETVSEYILALEVNPLDYYNIITIEYTPDNLASLFRIYNGCVPLNCTFEKDFEHKVYLDSLKALTDGIENNMEGVDN